MNYRLTTLLARKLYAADAVETIDIDTSDPISRISIILESVGVALPMTAHAVRHIIKIELVDGSNVLFSLSGAQAHAVACYNQKKIPLPIGFYGTGVNAEIGIDIDFGRWLWDEILALDPKKFTNPQLKISIDVNAGGFSAITCYVRVDAHCFDDKKISPIGFLMNKEIKSWVPTASTHEYTDLPTDMVYRKLFLRCQQYGVGPDYALSHVKLYEDEGKKVPLDHDILDILKTLVSQGPLFQECLILGTDTNGRYYYCTPGYFPTFQVTPWRSATAQGDPCAYEGDGGRFIVDLLSNMNTQVQVSGWCPHSTIEIAFGKEDIIEDWYDVTKVGSLKIDVTDGASAGATQSDEILLQQLMKY